MGRLEAWIDRHRFAPAWLFIGGSLSTVLLLYILPWQPLRLTALGFGILLLVLFVLYLRAYRSNDLASLVSIVPTILGPIAAYHLVILPTTQVSDCDLIVQLAFF